MDQLPRLGKREQICLLLFTCNYVVSVWRGFLFLWVLGMGYVILLWHSLSLPYNHFKLFIFLFMAYRDCFTIPVRVIESNASLGYVLFSKGLSSETVLAYYQI